MSLEEFKILSQKVADNSATDEERLLFLREMNDAMEKLHQNLTPISNNK